MSPEFWQMGGYANYVWGSFGFALAVHLWNLLAPRWQRRRVMDSLLDAAEDESAEET